MEACVSSEWYAQLHVVRGPKNRATIWALVTFLDDSYVNNKSSLSFESTGTWYRQTIPINFCARREPYGTDNCLKRVRIK
jgi:hypothetical protein